MDRVKAATETANALRGRLARYTLSPRRYSAELSGRLALQLHLVKEGIRDAFDNAPVELALVIEPVFDGAGDRLATLAWCHKMTAMYRAWAGKRRMQIGDLPGAGRDKDTPILLVSGFGAHRILSPEAGLHVFEPSEGEAVRVTARVRLAVVPLGDVPAAKERKVIIAALDEAPRPNAVVRRYREEPPLVRDCRRQVAHRPARFGARRRVRPAAGRPALGDLFVGLGQIIHRIVGELTGLDFAALGHVDDAFGDDFLGRPPVPGRRKRAARLLELAPGIFVRRNQGLDELGSKHDFARSDSIDTSYLPASRAGARPVPRSSVRLSSPSIGR